MQGFVETAQLIFAKLCSLSTKIAPSQPELLIIDMENVGFMDSSGIGLILGRLRAVRACGGDIIIKNARPEIAGVIKLSGLAGLLVETREVVK